MRIADRVAGAGELCAADLEAGVWFRRLEDGSARFFRVSDGVVERSASGIPYRLVNVFGGSSDGRVWVSRMRADFPVVVLSFAEVVAAFDSLSVLRPVVAGA
ncbi:hypothetical protein [Brevibacterium luteolum]|uniref:hypothetical protein n=1 Tax=Brevibacterium luteolum TaxID=199591 RepID=UPI00223B5F26|nr:hypothetical protein [Brevibacterium luteolum]MCT1658210.1 hypothetical protein [Brevibacterium luteolum]MCT1920930.1 hypothetical protein [Brevibacterium luteolum]